MTQNVEFPDIPDQIPIPGCRPRIVPLESTKGVTKHESAFANVLSAGPATSRPSDLSR